VNTDRGAGREPAADADPSLADGGVDGAFPDTAVCTTHLVLYQTADGAVDLRWRIDPADIAHARAAFGGADAQPVLRLRHLDGNGEHRLLADADLGGDDAAEGGVAHYDGADAEGLLQAEIGLASPDGGWMLVARSNALPAAAAVGAHFLRESEPAAAAPRYQRPATPEVTGPDERNADTPAAAAVTLRLEPEFPLVEPLLSAAVRREYIGRAARTLAEPPGETLGQGGAAAGPAGGEAALGLAGDVARRAQSQGEAEPPPGGVVPRLEPRPAAPTQQRPAKLAGDAPAAATDPGPVAGSGPLRHAAVDASLSAELVVRGSAPPYTLLDLGGHAYRVGPGGRFELHIPIREQALIARVLATLPQLPVAARSDDDGAASG
jgi:hypothetical protein